jgi:type VI secretion system protein ImpG
MAVVQFEPDRNEGTLVDGFKLQRGTALRSQLGPGDQTACEYRTSQDVTLWPISMEGANYTSRDTVASQLPSRFQDAKALLHLRLKTSGGVDFSRIPIDRLPIYLRGRDTRTMALYEQLFSDAMGVIVSWEGSGGTNVRVLDQPISPLGFHDDQALLRTGARSFQGYRLLHEYFAFQQRFLFLN